MLGNMFSTLAISSLEHFHLYKVQRTQYWIPRRQYNIDHPSNTCVSSVEAVNVSFELRRWSSVDVAHMSMTQLSFWFQDYLFTEVLFTRHS